MRLNTADSAMRRTRESTVTCWSAQPGHKIECAGPGWHLNTAAVLASTKSRRSSTKYRGRAGDRSHLSMASVEAAPHTRSAHTPLMCRQPLQSTSGTLLVAHAGGNVRGRYGEPQRQGALTHGHHAQIVQQLQGGIHAAVPCQLARAGAGRPLVGSRAGRGCRSSAGAWAR